LRNFLTILVLITLGGVANGQQQSQYSMSALNKYAFNPAFAGLDFSLSANLMYRNQWEGLSGNPSDLHINAHMPYYIWSGALGGIIERQSFGGFSQTSASGSYNFVESAFGGLISVGGRLGVTTLQLDGERVITPEGEYGSFISHNDPILLEAVDQGFGLKWDIGAYYYSKKLEAGVSVSQIPQSKISLERFSFDNTTHATGFLQYNFDLVNDIALMQSILLKTDFNQVQSELSSIFQINGNIFGGINLRGYSSQSVDAMAVIVGMKLGDHYTLAYSYDVGISGLRRTHEGTHEILLNYNLRKIIGTGQPPKIIYNPRYL